MNKSNQSKFAAVSSALSAEIPFKLITAAEVAAIHDAMVADYGGKPGIRDKSLLESAVGRQLQTATYDDCSIAAIAASLTFGIIQNHAFLDGNKRTAFGALLSFLDANKIDYDYDPVEAQQVMVESASGDLGERDIKEWIIRIADAQRQTQSNESKPKLF